MMMIRWQQVKQVVGKTSTFHTSVFGIIVTTNTISAERCYSMDPDSTGTYSRPHCCETLKFCVFGKQIKYSSGANLYHFMDACLQQHHDVVPPRCYIHLRWHVIKDPSRKFPKSLYTCTRIICSGPFRPNLFLFRFEQSSQSLEWDYLMSPTPSSSTDYHNSLDDRHQCFIPLIKISQYYHNHITRESEITSIL